MKFCTAVHFSAFKRNLSEGNLYGRIKELPPGKKKYFPKLHARCFYDKYPCIFLEYCDSDAYKYFVGDRKSIPRKICLDDSKLLPLVGKLIWQSLKALEVLKGLGLAHYDVKGPNLLLKVKKGFLGELKLCDFGMCSDQKEAVAYAKGNAGDFVTLHYRPPEILDGKYDEIDHAVDMWGVGCVIAEMFSGKILFPERKPEHVLSAQKALWNGNIRDNLSRKIFGKKYGKKSFSSPRDAAVDFIAKALALEPSKRLGIRAAFVHPFFSLTGVTKSLFKSA